MSNERVNIERLRELLAAVPGEWTWEEHGDGWALYSGRGPHQHGLNLLSTGADGFCFRGESTRALIVELRNAVPVLFERLAAAEARVAELETETRAPREGEA